ncbi:YnbE family lipoprotein [Novosphingobium sp. APW14]|uniref:YnbE family lipoprotein n=1 Tax=Novosphingobium sp. APW14 TaxID=3077237 RepID=UPI0028DE6531|nr:YnbE family lipoprotein [Novosphingobium sp. APW14]MDT9012720.1 YnbE family lipoprotein [Novosphingobium sp. APW14]
MKSPELTKPVRAATSSAMDYVASGQVRSMRQGSARAAAKKGLMMIAGALTLTGCISVNAPDKPIVIELNINIKQEVVYRLSADAGNTIKDNPGIF